MSTEESRNVLEKAKDLLQNGRFVEAEALLQKLVGQDKKNTEALYVLAVCQRYLKQLSSALATLQRVKDLQPAYGRAYQEEGHVHTALGSRESALQAYRHAVSLNNSLLASWQAIDGLLAEQNESELKSEAARQVENLSALPPELLSVRNMTAEHRYYEAEQLCRRFLKVNPRYVEGMRLLADLGVKSGVLDDAEFILESAVEFEPNNSLARHDYMTVLYRRQKYEQSLNQARILVESDPENLDFKISYANQAVAIGDYSSALQIYDVAITERPNSAGLHLVHGHALKTIGDVTPAIEAYRNSYRARPSFGDAYWSLANLKTYQFTDGEVRSMTENEKNSATVVEDRAHLCFALGKHFEDRKSFAESADFYIRGNALRKSQVQYDDQRMTQRLNLQMKYCNEELFASQMWNGHEAADPILVVGLPRAGSTLVEQILASHSQIDGTFELPNIPALAFRLAGRHRIDEEPLYPAILSDLTSDQLKEFGQAYIDDTRVHRSQAPFFIDKMPNNFRHVGLIQLILPNARIIDARRHPMACCFSGFKQLFASGQEFTYGLKEIGHYYRDYVALMDHWDKVLPGKILRVEYENVVSDLEGEVRRMLDFCELPFEDSCMNFYQSDRSVRTPSSEQVRQPIYKSGMDHWCNYEQWLEPLRNALGPLHDE